jgi:hypothetical protein
VPGLLQIPQVTRAVSQLGSPDHPADDVERRVALRMTRQKVLTQPAAPTLWAVLEEAALWRLDGHPVMRAQIQHLIEMTTLPNITLQVIPLDSGPHMAIGGPFTILRFSEPDLPDIVYLEHLTSALYLDKKTDVDHYMMVMNRLCVHAKPLWGSRSRPSPVTCVISVLGRQGVIRRHGAAPAVFDLPAAAEPAVAARSIVGV